MAVEPKEFLRLFPALYHVSLAGNLEMIERHGLLSTTALLDLFEIPGDRRKELEGRRRQRREQLTHPLHGEAWLNDQIPLYEGSLARCLDGMTIEEWIKELNSRVFFWPNIKRLKGHLAAMRKRSYQHVVLEIDTAELFRLYGNTIELSPINSGNARRKAARRGGGTFLSLEKFPFERRRTVAEVTVPYAVKQTDLFREVSV